MSVRSDQILQSNLRIFDDNITFCKKTFSQFDFPPLRRRGGKNIYPISVLKCRGFFLDTTILAQEMLFYLIGAFCDLEEQHSGMQNGMHTWYAYWLQPVCILGNSGKCHDTSAYIERHWLKKLTDKKALSNLFIYLKNIFFKQLSFNILSFLEHYNKSLL